MCQLLLMGWAVTVTVSVFILYVRDPFASGKRSMQSSRMDRFMPKLRSMLRGVCDQLCARKLCFSPCANPS